LAVGARRRRDLVRALEAVERSGFISGEAQLDAFAKEMVGSGLRSTWIHRRALRRRLVGAGVSNSGEHREERHTDHHRAEEEGAHQWMMGKPSTSVLGALEGLAAGPSLGAAELSGRAAEVGPLVSTETFEGRWARRGG